MRNRKRAFYKRKTVIAASALSILAVLGLAGVYRMETAKNEKAGQELVNWEESSPGQKEAEVEDSLLEANEEKQAELVNKDEADGQESRLNNDEVREVPVPGVDTDEQKEEEEQPSVTEQQTDAAQASVQNAINLNFSPETGMVWPVEGNVVLDYSMEQSVYFPTLDQYKYNPAIAIQSEMGTPVVAAAAGVVTSIVETDETGLTMTVDMGNGYEAVYGQLADVSLSTGSYVEAGSRIAVVAEPSIYYQVEGDNLYFQVLKDGKPTDPLDYIR